jgi:hypothetical protein
MGLGLICFSLTTSFPLALFFAATIGIGAVSQHVGAPDTVLAQGIIGLVLGLGGLRIASSMGKHQP